jgi:hypothetical protein
VLQDMKKTDVVEDLPLPVDVLNGALKDVQVIFLFCDPDGYA